MSTRSILAVAALASTALAGPLTYVKRNGPDNCGPTLGDNGEQKYIADVGYYSDSDCNEMISYFCVYSGPEIADGASGGYVCENAGAPSTTPYYAKVKDTAYPDLQLIYTQDQSCPPNGPGAVFATLINNQACVEMNVGGSAPGLSVYPQGGSNLAKKIKKRDAKCSGFNIESQTASESQSVQISSIVDCTNSADSGCTITMGSEHTESVSTSYSVTAGGGIEGIFEVSATFGMEYTESETTSLQEGFSISPGQKGYLSAYCAATLFKGTYTGCDSGDAEQPGEALVLKQNGFSYAVIYTGA